MQFTRKGEAVPAGLHAERGAHHRELLGRGGEDAEQTGIVLQGVSANP